jgi:hypothetical protein
VSPGHYFAPSDHSGQAAIAANVRLFLPDCPRLSGRNPEAIVQ